MAGTESNFEEVYKVVKGAVVSALLNKKHGEVVFLLDDLTTYLSNAWLELALVKLRKELNTEFGITQVYLRKPDSVSSTKAAIILE